MAAGRGRSGGHAERNGGREGEKCREVGKGGGGVAGRRGGRCQEGKGGSDRGCRLWPATSSRCLPRKVCNNASIGPLTLTSNKMQVVFKLESPALIDDSLRCPPALRQLLTRCYSRDQTLRPSSAQVLEGLKIIQADLGIVCEAAK